MTPDENDLPRGVICAEGDPEELSETIAEGVESGTSAYTAQPYSEMFINPETDPHSELARVYIDFPETGEHDQRVTSLLFHRHMVDDLPGLVDERDPEFQEFLEDTVGTPPG